MNSIENGNSIKISYSIEAFIYILYKELLIIMTLSVVFFICSLPIVTTGAAFLSLHNTLFASINNDDNHNQNYTSRLEQYFKIYYNNIREGVPYSIIIATLMFTIYSYQKASAFTDPLIGFVSIWLSFLILICFTVWLLRAATISLQSPDDSKPFWDLIYSSALISLEYPYYTILHLTAAGILILIAVALPNLIFLILPGSLVLLEIVTFEDISGDKAKMLLARYREL